MKTTKVIAFLFLILVCSAAISSAQIQITEINRGVITRLYHEGSHYVVSSEHERSLDLGEYTAGVEMSVGDGELSAGQTTQAANEDYLMATMSGHLKISVVQPASDFPHGMDSHAGVQIFYTSPFTCDYSLSGVVSGPGQGTLEIRNWGTWELITKESWTGTEFTTSGQLPPGNYFVDYSLLDYVFGSEPVSRYSESDFDIVIIPQLPVAIDEMSFGAVKALFR